MKGAWSTGDYTGDTETRSTRLWNQVLENEMEPYRKAKLPGRNDKCPCGSGKKAKKCCLNKIKVLAALPPHIREQVVVAKILGRLPWSKPTAPAAVKIAGGTLTTENGISVPVKADEIVLNTVGNPGLTA